MKYIKKTALRLIVLAMIISSSGCTGYLPGSNSTDVEDVSVTAPQETDTLETTIEETPITPEETTEEIAEETTIEEVIEVLPQENTFGTTFEFDGFEMTFNESVSWTVLNNHYDEFFGSSVFKVPVTVKNVGTQTNEIDMFSLIKYGSKGTQLQGIEIYFDDSLEFAGKLRQNAVLESYIYFLYDGDGDYYIEFDDFLTTVEIRLPIAKPETQTKMVTQTAKNITFSYPETCTYSFEDEKMVEIGFMSGNTNTGNIVIAGISNDVSLKEASDMLTQGFEQTSDYCDIIFQRETTFLTYQAENLRLNITRGFDDTIVDYYIFNLDDQNLLIGYESEYLSSDRNIEIFNLFLNSITFE